MAWAHYPSSLQISYGKTKINWKTITKQITKQILDKYTANEWVIRLHQYILGKVTYLYSGPVCAFREAGTFRLCSPAGIHCETSNRCRYRLERECACAGPRRVCHWLNRVTLTCSSHFYYTSSSRIWPLNHSQMSVCEEDSSLCMCVYVLVMPVPGVLDWALTDSSLSSLWLCAAFSF